MTLAENVVAIDGPPAYDPSLPYRIADLALADFKLWFYQGQYPAVFLYKPNDGRNDNF